MQPMTEGLCQADSWSRNSLNSEAISTLNAACDPNYIRTCIIILCLIFSMHALGEL